MPGYRLHLKGVVWALCFGVSISSVKAFPPAVFVGPGPSCAAEINRALALGTSGEQVIPVVRRILTERGYLDATVVIRDSTLTVVAGKRYGVSRINIVGDTLVSYHTSTGFERGGIERQLEPVLESFQKRGRYYARLQPTEASVEGDSVELTYRLDMGPAMAAEGYRFKGLRRTRPEAVQRFLPDPTGGPITPELLDDISYAAWDIDFLKLERGPEVVPAPGFQAARLSLLFAEKKPALFEGGLGYESDIEEFVWNLRLKLVNLFGSGRQAEILSSRPDKGHNILDVKYRQPMFLLGGGYVGLRLFTRDYRQSFYEFGASGGYEWRLDRHLRGSISLEWKRVDPADSIVSYTRTGLTLAASRSTLDRRPAPKSGTGLKWSVAYRHRRFESSDSLDIAPINDTQTLFEIERRQPLISSLGLRGSFAYETIISNDPDLPLSELMLVGGPGSIRGFRNEQFAVTTALTATLEPYLRFESGRIGLFYDAAYLFEPSDESGNSSDFYRFGFGLALDIIGVDRSLNLSLGWSRDLAIDQPRLSLQFVSDI